MGSKILIAVLGGLVIWAGWVGFTGWNLESDVQMDANGYAAMIIGIVGSLVVGIALMTLVFYSSRKGYDDAAGHNSERSDDEGSRRV